MKCLCGQCRVWFWTWLCRVWLWTWLLTYLRPPSVCVLLESMFKSPMIQSRWRGTISSPWQPTSPKPFSSLRRVTVSSRYRALSFLEQCKQGVSLIYRSRRRPLPQRPCRQRLYHPRRIHRRHLFKLSPTRLTTSTIGELSVTIFIKPF
jgi:hypothetical protein